MHQIQVQVDLRSILCLLHFFGGQAVIREIAAHHVLLGVIRLRSGLREHAVLAAAHPRRVLPRRLLLPLRSVLPGDQDHQIVPACRVLLAFDSDFLLQALQRDLLMVPVGYPRLMDGEMVEVFVFLRNEQLPLVVGVVSLLRGVES